MPKHNSTTKTLTFSIEKDINIGLGIGLGGVVVRPSLNNTLETDSTGCPGPGGIYISDKLLVSSVKPNGPSDGKLKVGDEIIEFEGKDVSDYDMEQWSDLLNSTIYSRSSKDQEQEQNHETILETIKITVRRKNVKELKKKNKLSVESGGVKVAYVHSDSESSTSTIDERSVNSISLQYIDNSFATKETFWVKYFSWVRLPGLNCWKK